MASILEQLEVKPVPKSRKGVKIAIPKEQVGVKIKIIDRTTEDFDRAAVMLRLQQRGLSVPKMKQKQKIKILTEALLDEKPPLSKIEKELKEWREDPVNWQGKEVTSVTPKIKIKKLGRLKISKKGAPTTKDTVPSVKKSIGRIKLPTKISIRRSQLPPAIIKFKQSLDKILPKPEPSVKIRAASYYMTNREIFINFINSLFAPYKAALEEEAEHLTCQSIKEKKAGKFSLLTHQEIVRDYINLFTPYRGLLIYHGLGAGKTCASIAIAEGFQTPKQIMIMTPASLQMNYKSELKVCGNNLYRINQYWEFISNDNNPRKTQVLAQMLSISESYVRKQKGAWFVNIKKKPNYDTLDTQEKISLNKQIEKMIDAKYVFRNYNGLRKSHLAGLTNNGKINPFSNKVVIIDEAHNFVSRIVNKMNKPDSLSMKLYEYLLSAEQCRIVLLTGTPIINYPNEIGILFNILRGYIRTFRFNLSIRTRDKVNQQTFEDIIGNLGIQDYVAYNSSSKTLVITRNPFGFINTRSRSRMYEGVQLSRQGQMPTAKFIAIVTRRLEDADIGVLKVTEGTPYKALPDTLDEFKAMFINPGNNSLKNSNLFKRRVLGLTSYFRSAQEELMPRFDIEKDLVIEMIPMSDYQFGIYETARSEERKMELRNARRKKGGDEEDSISTYRIFSRAFCNFVFPPEIVRPKPKEGEQIEAILKRNADEDILDIVSLQEQIANVDGKHELDDEENLRAQRETDRDKTYEKRIRTAILKLKANAAQYLDPSGLAIYSPKFLEMYKNINEEAGLHLVYSQFRTLEGIGIFTMVLDQNGFAPFQIGKDTKGIWRIIEKPEDENKQKYVLYTGTENKEVKEMMRLIFNGDWENLPTSLRDTLNERAENNNYGEIIKIFMITSSGAEGITLKNVRYVHIVEPYWHPVRMEQVIGRARRICSHENLLVEERAVKVYLYLMKFTDEQLVPAVAKDGMASKGLLEKDVSKLDKTTPLTSDQALFEISTIKEDINRQLLRAIKESAFDCALHAKSDDKDPLICMSFGTPLASTFATTPALTIEKDYDEIDKRNKEKIMWIGQEVNISGKRYAFKPDKPGSKTGEIYDLESYKRAVRSGSGEGLIALGHLLIDPQTKKLYFKWLAN